MRKALCSLASPSGSGGESRVPSVDRALDLLEVLAFSKRTLTLSDIGRKLQIPISSAHYLVQSLSRRGYLHRSVFGRGYSLGLRAADSVYPTLAKAQLVSTCSPHLHRLVHKLGLPAQVGSIEGEEAVVISTANANPSGRLAPCAGRHFDLHCTALGKALIASFSWAELEGVFRRRGLLRHNQNTICSLKTLESNLAEARVQGYAVDNEEHGLGVRCIAAPIFNSSSRVVAAVCVFSSTSQIPDWRIPSIGGEVLEAAKNISRNLNRPALCNEESLKQGQRDRAELATHYIGLRST